MNKKHQSSNLIFSDNQEITEEVIDYYEKNPEELDLIINKEYFHAVFLGIFFFLGLIITIAARIVQYYFGEDMGELMNTVILDIISELGIAIFGGAIVAYLLEFLSKRQYQQNVKFRKQVKLKLEERRQNKRS